MNDFYKLEKIGAFTVAYLSGRLDIALTEEIEQEFYKLIEQGNVYLIIDLQDVNYFSSSAMRVLIAIKRKVDAKNGKLKLSRTSKMVDKIMSALELIKVFEIYDSVEEAIEAG